MDVSRPAEAIDRAGRDAARYIRRMSEVLDIAAIAALVGDPARANMLCALLDGRALTASELAYAAHITPQTASGHLGKLAKASLIVPAQQGRHRYYRLAGVHVAAMMESISAVSAIAPPRLKPIRIDDKMREARMCYDHIAGRLGVTLADALRAQHHVEFADDGGVVTPSGEAFFAGSASISRPRARAGACSAVPASTGASGVRTSPARSEPHLANRLMELRWIARRRDTRALAITPIGWSNIERTFGCSLHDHTVHERPVLRVVG